MAAARARLARHHADRFAAAGAGDVGIVAGPPDGLAFGARVRSIIAADRPGGLVLLGSGAIPLATRRDVRDLVDAAAADDRVALTNNRYSADAIAISQATEVLADLPDLPSDNALPRWLAEVAGYTVHDLRGRWRLGIDIDGPLDLVLIGGAAGSGAAGDAASAVETSRVRERLAAVRAVTHDPRAELLVAGRTSATTLGWLERSTAGRTRALVEERGLRTSVAGQGPPGLRPGRTDRARRAGARSGATSRSCPTPRSSTAGCSLPTASAPTRAAGPPPRTVSHPTCCSPSASPIRGSRELAGVHRRRADPDPAGRPHARRTGCPARHRQAAGHHQSGCGRPTSGRPHVRRFAGAAGLGVR